jgi:antitoxin (DNA-binding transcriptional repressor) of toxin-antitoxin stability system
MNRSITATALRQELRNLLTTLGEGPIEITKHGKVVAVLAAPSTTTDTSTCTSFEEVTDCSETEDSLGAEVDAMATLAEIAAWATTSHVVNDGSDSQAQTTSFEA